MRGSLLDHIKKLRLPLDKILDVSYVCLGINRQKKITRCSANLSGNTGSVLIVSFSPDGEKLCSGSSDGGVYFWELSVHMPMYKSKIMHYDWVLVIAWSSDGLLCASGGMDGGVGLWKGITKCFFDFLRGHCGWVSCLRWEPSESEYSSRRLASGSRDSSIRVWDAWRGKCLMILNSHLGTVRTVEWDNNGRLYSGSADSFIKVWSLSNGNLICSLKLHENWVNTISISKLDSSEHGSAKKQNELNINQIQRLVSGSDDSTMFLWDIPHFKLPKARMIGHRLPVSHVCFSPNGFWFVSVSFDTTVKLWNGMDGQFIASFTGHKDPVYICAWSPDSNFIVSASKDSTLKIWDIKKKVLIKSLLGHSEDVFAVDWNPKNSCIVSGGKDGLLKLWSA